MAPSLAPGVERRLESPDPEATVRLIVETTGHSDATRTALTSCVEAIHDELPLGAYSVTVSETDLDALCKLTEVERVDIDSEATVFDSDESGGVDFRFRSG